MPSGAWPTSAPRAGAGAAEAGGSLRPSSPVSASWDRAARAGAGLRWRISGGLLSLDRPMVMGIVNLTPDSFSDGGELPTLDAALARAGSMVEAGAQILDVGGESTRPGAAAVPPDEEAARILPFLEAAAARFPVPLSVDTRRASVARSALDAGARIVNDVSGLAHDPEMGPLLAGTDAGVILMHMRGEPATMQERAVYDDVVAEVAAELAGTARRAEEAGIEAERIALDPGLGFAKTAEHNLALLRCCDVLAPGGRPLVVGSSRKAFLGRILGVPPRERVAGTVAACLAAWLGGARVLRVHDVRPVVDALRVAEAVARGTVDPGPGPDPAAGVAAAAGGEGKEAG